MERRGRRSRFAGWLAVIALLVSLTLVFPAGAAAADEDAWSDVSGIDVSLRINRLAWDETGQRLFATTDNGVQTYKPALGTWSSVGLEGYYTVELLLEEENLWVWALKRGLCRYSLETGTWQDIGMGPSVCRDIESDGSGVYIAAWDEGLWYFNSLEGSWNRVGENEIPGYRITSLAWDGSGLYVGTYSHGVLYYRPGENSWTNLGGELDYAYYGIESLLLHDGYLYVGADAKGLWGYDPQEGTWKDLVHCEADMVDWGGSFICIAAYTDFSGVRFFNPATGESKQISDGISSSYVTCFAWDGACLYAGTPSMGLFRYCSQTETWIRLGGAIKRAWARAMAWDGAVLYAAEYGIWALDVKSGTWTDISLREGPRNASAMLWGGDSLYVGDSKELWRYYPPERSWKLLGILEGENENISSLALAGSEVYVGTNQGRIWRYDPGTGAWGIVFSHYYPIDFCALAWDGSGLCAGYNALVSVIADFIGGVWRYVPDVNVCYDLIPATMNDDISSLAWDGAHLYVGREKSGLWKYTPSGGALENLNGNAGVSLSVKSLFWDGSSLYVGTESKGVWRYDPSNGSLTDTGGWISGSSVYSLAGDASHLFAWANKNGIWRYGHRMAPAIDSVVPNRGTQLDLWLGLTAIGRGFKAGAWVVLRKGSVTVHPLQVNIVSDTRFTAFFCLLGAEPGVYDLVLVNPDGEEAVLAQCFRVSSACGTGSGAALLPLGIALGLLSTGTLWRRRRRR